MDETEVMSEKYAERKQGAGRLGNGVGILGVFPLPAHFLPFPLPRLSLLSRGLGASSPVQLSWFRSGIRRTEFQKG